MAARTAAPACGSAPGAASTRRRRAQRGSCRRAGRRRLCGSRGRRCQSSCTCAGRAAWPSPPAQRSAVRRGEHGMCVCVSGGRVSPSGRPPAPAEAAQASSANPQMLFPWLQHETQPARSHPARLLRPRLCRVITSASHPVAGLCPGVPRRPHCRLAPLPTGCAKGQLVLQRSEKVGNRSDGAAGAGGCCWERSCHQCQCPLGGRFQPSWGPPQHTQA